MFRVFPARHSPQCGTFDPRVRPWYIAASSGPKNVVLVVDTSGSMQGRRLQLLKIALRRVISTLTVADRVVLIPFNRQATAIGDAQGRLLTATAENKRRLLQQVDGLVAEGGTDFYPAFQKAFASLDASIEAELTVSCNTAVLFLTDGETFLDPQGIGEPEIIELVRSGLDSVTQKLGKPALLFSLSITDNNNVNDLPKRLACASGPNGVWSKIVDDRQIEESLAGYYRLFALGLGEDQEFVAWVEPFEFQPSLVLGTVASAPVYDRSKSPPLFLGVVGFSFTLEAMDKALGVQAGDQATLDRVVAASTAKCPSLNLTKCELESYRRQSSTGDEALCNVGECSASDFVNVEATECPSVTDYPTNLWNNVNQRSVEYQVRSFM